MFFSFWKKYIFLLLLFLGGGYFLTYHHSMMFSFFSCPLKTLGILGCKKMSSQDLATMLKLKKGDNLWTLSLRALEKQIREIPWVRHVWIWRRFPSTLCIVIQEKEEWALWHQGEKPLPTSEQGCPLQKSSPWVLIDNQGAIIQEADPKDYPLLPMIYGPKGPKEFQNLLKLLWTSGRFLGVKKAHYQSSGRWELVVDVKSSDKNRLLLGLDSPYGHGVKPKESPEILLIKMPWIKKNEFLGYLETHWSFLKNYGLVDGRFSQAIMVKKFS